MLTESVIIEQLEGILESSISERSLLRMFTGVPSLSPHSPLAFSHRLRFKSVPII